MQPRRRTFAFLLTAATLTVSLTACGGDDAESAGDTPASETPSETASGTPSEPATESDDGVADGAEGAFLARLKDGMGDKGTVHLRMRMTGPVETTAEGDTAYGPGGSEMRMIMAMPQMGDMRMEMLVVDDVAYLAMPGVTPKGKFFRVPEDSPLMEGVGGPGGMSPAESFAGFEAGLEKVVERGEAVVGGETTDRYRLHVDAARSMEALEMGPVPGLPETLVYDLWVDAEDRMRRMVYEMGGAEIVVDMTDWGKKVTFTAPAKKELVDAPPGI